MNDITLLPDERLDKVNEKLTLIQKKNGLTFGTDAFLLASFIKSAPQRTAAELGSGTGIISLLLAQRNKLSKISAIEIQKDFAELTERNARLNSLDDKIIAINADATSIKASDIGGELDVVFTNPPYMKTDSGKRNDSDAKYIARHEVCGDINAFCKAGFRLLKHGGKFYVVWRPDRLCDLFAALRANRLEPKIITFVHADAQSEPSIVLVSAIKGGASGAKVTPPLILYDDAEHKKMSEQATRIYDTLSFD
jgi:tRNA1Val (adenine37-N6)-methyltransferase